jgi:hypothetical protein
MANRTHSGFLLGLFFDPEDGGDMPLRNVGRLSTGLQGIVSQKKELFKKQSILIIVLLRKRTRTM